MAGAFNQWQVPTEEDHPGPNQRDSAILEEAFKGEHRVALEALWNGIIGDKYRTEAETKLCSILVAYIGEGPRKERAEQIDRLFRRSGLYDPDRWTARDRDRTIEPILDGNDHQSSKTKSTPLASQYVVEHGSMFWKKNRTTKIQLANFAAKITKEVLIDDGMQPVRTYTIDAVVSDEPKQCVVTAQEFEKMAWVGPKLGAKAIVSAGRSMQDHARAAIQDLSPDVRKETIYHHTGWREMNGVYRFLHNGGAVGATGVLTDLRLDRLENYDLGSTPGNIQEAVRQSFNFLKIGKPSVLYPLLAIIYRAPLCHFIPCTTLPHLCGRSGTFKSTIAAAALSHFGRFPTKESLPAHWSFTGTILEKVSFLAKDVALVIDDLFPESGPKMKEALEAAFSRMIGAIGDSTGRRRATSTLETRPEYFPRGVVLSTGEYTPTLSTSRQARLFVIPVEAGDIDPAALTVFQRGLESLPVAMRAYIEFIGDGFCERGAEIRSQFEERRGQLNTVLGTHRRLSENVAHLQIGMENAVMFAESVGAMSGEEGRAHNAACLECLVELATKQAAQIVHDLPSRIFLDVIQEGLLSGDCWLADRKTGQAVGGSAGAGYPKLGWADNDGIYLLSEKVFAYVSQRLRHRGGFPGPLAALKDALKHDGYLLQNRSEPGRLEANKSCEGTVTRVLWLRPNAVQVVRSAGHSAVYEPFDLEDLQK